MFFSFACVPIRTLELYLLIAKLSLNDEKRYIFVVPSRTKRQEATLWLLVFLDMFGFTMLVPDLQFHIKGLGAKDWQIGAILTAMFAAQTVFSPLWSSLSDKVGRKRILLLCTGFSAAAMFLYAWSNTLLLVVAVRVLAGMGAANVSVANAMLYSLTPPDKRDEATGGFFGAMSAGLILGPVAGGNIAAMWGRLPLGILAGSLSLLGILAAVAILPQDEPVSTEKSKEKFRLRLSLFRDVPAIRVLAVVAMVSWFALALLEGTFGLLIQHTLGLGEREFGLIFGFESIIGLLCQKFVMVRLRQRWSRHGLLATCLLLQGIGLGLTPVAPSLGFLFVASALFAFGNSLTTPLVNLAASDLVPESRHGELFGLFQGSRGFGFMVAPAIGTQLFSLAPPYPYFAAAGVCTAGAMTLWFGTSRLRPDAQALP